MVSVTEPTYFMVPDEHSSNWKFMQINQCSNNSIINVLAVLSINILLINVPIISLIDVLIINLKV